MAKTRRTRRTPPRRGAAAEARTIREGAELIVMTKPAARIRARQGGAEVTSLSGADTRGLARTLARVRLIPLFGNEDRVTMRGAALAAETGRTGPNLSVFYKVDAPTERLQALAEELLGEDAVEAAYVKPAAEPPIFNDIPANPADAPPVTPDFTANQVYLEAAPGGVEALWAHTQPGGRGDGIRIIDIEGAWRFSHEDLMQVQGGVVGGVPSTDIGWRNHGTAVIGVFGGDQNSIRRHRDRSELEHPGDLDFRFRPGISKGNPRRGGPARRGRRDSDRTASARTAAQLRQPQRSTRIHSR